MKLVVIQIHYNTIRLGILQSEYYINNFSIFFFTTRITLENVARNYKVFLLHTLKTNRMQLGYYKSSLSGMRYLTKCP